MSIRVRFMFLIGFVSLLFTIAIAVAGYQFSVNNAVTEAKSKGHLIFDYLQSTRVYYREHQRGKIFELAGKDRFIPEIMSGFAITRGIWDEFVKRNSDYHFKQATIDPLYPANKADETDLAIIKTFKDDPTVEKAEGTIDRNGETFYYFAQPIRVDKKGCLHCHGEPSTAPREQIELYGTEHGYHWKMNEVVSTYVVYVPLGKALAKAQESAITIILIGSTGLVFLMFLIWIFFSHYVIKPVTMLEKRATEISLGKNLTETIISSSKDEIGSLSRAVDRLRISVEKMLQRFSK